MSTARSRLVQRCGPWALVTGASDGTGHCTGVLALASRLGPRLVKRGRGGVVFMGSLLAFHGTPRAANYAATKAYVQTLA